MAEFPLLEGRVEQFDTSCLKKKTAAQ